MDRPKYEVLEGITKTLSHGKYVRVRLENILTSSNSLPITLKIGQQPGIDLTREQIINIKLALQFDDTVKQVVRLLEQNVIHKEESLRNSLVSLFDI